MRILFVLEHFHPYIGGAEELFLSLARQLVQSGHHVEVVTTLYDHSLPAKEVYEGIKIERVRCGNRFMFTLLSLPVVFRKAKEADVIHTTSYNAALPAWISGKFRGKKTIITFHEVWGKLWFKLPFLSFTQKLLYFTFEKLIVNLTFGRFVAVSAYTQRALVKAGVDKSKAVQIYNGIDYARLSNYKHQQPDSFTFCYFGRLGVSKGLDLLIPAFSRLLKVNPDARLKLIIPRYPAPLFRKTAAMIERAGISKSIEMLHDLDKHRLMQEVTTSSCVVIPSYSEGFCFTAVEACATGVPVISSGCGALAETVSGKHLHLSELSVDELFSAMQKAIAGKWDEKPLRVFSLQDCVEGYLKIYNQLL